MVKKDLKKGFSIAETLVSMLILSIFFGIAAKMITQRPKDEAIVTPHGYFECYYDDGKLKYRNSIKDSQTVEISDSNNSGRCTFSPLSIAAIYDIIILYEYNASYSGRYNYIIYTTTPSMQYNLKFQLPHKNKQGNDQYIKIWSSESINFNEEKTDCNEEDNCIWFGPGSSGDSKLGKKYGFKAYELNQNTYDEFKNKIKNAYPEAKMFNKDSYTDVKGGVFISW